MSSSEKKDSSRIASLEFDSYADTSVTLFHVSTILLCAFILSYVYLSYLSKYKHNQCKFSRSDFNYQGNKYYSQTAKFCMNDHLFCNAFESSENYAESAINSRETYDNESINFPSDSDSGIEVVINYDGTGTGDYLSLGDGNDYGFSVNNSTVYLGGITSEPNFSLLAGNAIAALLSKKIGDSTREVAYYDESNKVFVYHGSTSELLVGKNITSSLEEGKGIFDKKNIPILSNREKPYHKSAFDSLLKANKTIDSVSGYKNDEDYDAAVNTDNSISANLRCVDPSLIIPCGNRIFDGVSWCNPGTSDCIYHCNTDIYNQFSSSNTQKGGYTTLQNTNSGQGADIDDMYYQTVGFGTAFEKNMLKNSDNITYTQGVKSKVALDKDNFYSQNYVLCGGTEADVSDDNNNYKNPTTSRFPTKPLDGKKGFFGM